MYFTTYDTKKIEEQMTIHEKNNLHPIAKRKGYRQNESPINKTKAEQSFCYAPTGESGCIFFMRYFGGFLLWGRRRRKLA